MRAGPSSPLFMPKSRRFLFGRRNSELVTIPAGSLASSTVDGGGENCLDAAGLPLRTIDSSPARLADDRVDFGSLVFGSPTAHCDQPPNFCRRQQGRDLQKRSGNHPARSRIWIEQEHNRGAPRKGCISRPSISASGKALYLVAQVHLTEDRESIKAGREMDSPRKG
jgi:hypothetical protein